MIADHRHRFALHVSYRSRPVLILTLAGVFVFFCFLAIGYLFNESTKQRNASCKAQQVALGAIRIEAEAGIRRIQTVPAGLPPALDTAFKSQLAQTMIENERRQSVIVFVTKASRDLARSDFCQ